MEVASSLVNDVIEKAREEVLKRKVKRKNTHTFLTFYGDFFFFNVFDAQNPPQKPLKYLNPFQNSRNLFLFFPLHFCHGFAFTYSPLFSIFFLYFRFFSNLKKKKGKGNHNMADLIKYRHCAVLQTIYVLPV